MAAEADQPSPNLAYVQVLSEVTWRERSAAHEARVHSATAAHLERRDGGRKHPVEDFLFTYYSFTPAQLRRWHPGAGVTLASSGSPPSAPQHDWRHYTTTPAGVTVDVVGFMATRGDTVRFARDLLTQTAGRPGRFGCFGLHEWAMVYRQSPTTCVTQTGRCGSGPEGTDAVVEGHQIACSHFDAFRFFTPPAVSRNRLAPTRVGQAASEQPGCLHAGMDLYKWAHKLVLLVPSDLVMDCFDHARAIRALDMRAAPYDLCELGYDPIAIETPEGKAEYAAEQRQFAFRGQSLRARLLGALAVVAVADDEVV